MKKNTVIYWVFLFLALVLTGAVLATRYISKNLHAFTGNLVAWNHTDGGTYEIQCLDTGEYISLSPKQYSEIYQEIGFGVDDADDILTISVYRDGENILAFSAEQYSITCPVMLGNCVYYVAAENAEAEQWYLWKYEDGQIQKCTDHPVLWNSPVVFSENQLLVTLDTENPDERTITVYDAAAKELIPVCKGLSPCYAPQDNSIYFIDRIAGHRLARFDLSSSETEVLDIRCGTLCPMAYSATNNALVIQVDDGQQVSPFYSIYELGSNRHTIFTYWFRFLMGWQDGTISASKTQWLKWVE